MSVRQSELPNNSTISRCLKLNLKNKLRTLLSDQKEMATPVVRASYYWSIVSDQLKDILGPEIHGQWFKNVKPIVVSHKVITLETPSYFASHWINAHYTELIDVLLGLQDPHLSCFFVTEKPLLKSARAHI